MSLPSDDDEYLESVSRVGYPNWASETGSRRVLSPFSVGRPVYTGSRPFSIFSGHTLKASPGFSVVTRDLSTIERSYKSENSRCLAGTLLVVGTISLLSIIAAIFIATVGLNNVFSL